MVNNIDEFLEQYPNLKMLTAEGGFKKVFKGTHPMYGDIVVKKGKFSSSDKTIRERTKREFEALKAVDSRYYPTQYDFYIDDQEFVIVEEFIEGGTLASQMSKYTGNEGKIIIFFNELIDALSIIWSEKIVHRDLKPANIMIRLDQSPCVIDLGVARFIDKPGLTKTILGVPGTPYYAAPEQLNNQRLRVDIRTDFFILGIVLLEMYLGKHPFKTTIYEQDIIPNIQQGIYHMPSSASNAFQHLAGKMLKVKRHERWNSYDKLKEVLIQNWNL